MFYPVSSVGFHKHPDYTPELGEDAATSGGPPSPLPTMTEEEHQELQEELAKVRRETSCMLNRLSPHCLLCDTFLTLFVSVPFNPTKKKIHCLHFLL